MSTVNLRIPALNGQCYRYRQECIVIDLSVGCDIILGDDWLRHNNAELSFPRKECTVTTAQGKLTLAPIPRTFHRKRSIHIISAIQCRKYFEFPRSDERIFLVNVIDDGITPLATPGGGEDDAHPLDPPEQVNFPSQVSADIRQVLHNYRNVFEKMPGKLVDRGIDHVIPTEPGVKPAFRPGYRLSPVEIKEVERQISELLIQGLIEPSSSPYGAPVIFVQKKDKSLRMCLDYRKLNSQTIKSKYPLPRIDQLIDQLNGVKVLSSLDLQSGYYQIRISPEDVPKTAFLTPFGQYQFKVMSFGLCNAPSTFQAVMNRIFDRYLNKFMCVYLDDILIYSKVKEDHPRHLAQVLQVLKENEFYVKLSKCDFEKKELKFLGHIVGADGVKVDPAKTVVVKEWQTPQNVANVRSFLGLANYFRKFLPAYALITAPLVKLTRKGLVWGPDTWSAECEQAFQAVKEALTSAPTLTTPDFENWEGMEVICDASTLGIGSVLTQNGKPIAYESRKLSDTEKNWSTGDQELWAVIHSLTIWRCYLEGIKFTVVTDHNPLVHLQTQPNLSRRQARWSEYLQRFDFDWVHRPGRDNVADPLSRLPFQSILMAITMRNQRVATAVAPVASGSSVLPAQRRGRPPKMRTMPQPRSRAPTARTVNDLLQSIKEGYDKDPWFNDEAHTRPFTRHNGLWYSKDRIVVPNALEVRNHILYEMHDAPYSGHTGVAKTLEHITRHYWWPHMRKSVELHVAACEACQRNKSSNRKPAGLLQPLAIPKRPWDSVSMDFVTGLPLTKRKHDCILVFVDRLTKMVHLAPTTTEVDAEATAGLFRDNVWRLHGMPLDIVTDRGTQFSGKFFQALMKSMGTVHSMSTAFHPQSDGQTERVNRVLEEMLRHYVMTTHEQIEWDECLSLAEFAINNSVHESTANTPFRLNGGRNPRTPLSVPGIQIESVPAAKRFAKQIALNVTMAKKSLEAAQQRQKRYADERRREVVFTEGDKVLLKTTNLKLRHAHDHLTTVKLLPKWVGPFTVIQRVGKVAYRLELPHEWARVHPVFHVSLIKPYTSGTGMLLPPLPILIDGAEYYRIDRIIDYKIVKVGRHKKREYLIRWQGFGPEHDSWEPENYIAESEGGETLRQYLMSVGQAPPPPASRRS
jgi:hypothetical protein